MNSEKNGKASRIDMAARVAGVVTAFLMYGFIFWSAERVGLARFAVSLPMLLILLAIVLPVCGIMGMGLAYVEHKRPSFPSDWKVVSLDGFLTASFYLGWVALPLSLIWVPAVVMMPAGLFASALGYRIIARRRSRRPAGDENNKD